MKPRLLLTVALTTVACGGSGPTAPSRPSGPTTHALSGTIRATSGAPVAAATIAVLDGPNVGRSAVTDRGGQYRFAALIESGFTVTISAPYFVSRSIGVTLTADQVLDGVLTPTPLFEQIGTGDTVFTMPSTVTRIRIQADYAGSSANFIVHIDGQGVVNELLGTFWHQTHFDGTYLTGGGITEILHASGVAWRFTEVRP